jgi:hypothetical protein
VAGSRSDAFFFDFDGIKNLFDIRGKRNFTPHLSGKSPWIGVDSNTEANVFSTVVELATSEPLQHSGNSHGRARRCATAEPRAGESGH